MEKEIYLTESPYYSEVNETNTPGKDKVIGSMLQIRPQSCKLNSQKLAQRFPQENYYDDKKIKPGISIYKTIIDIQERRANGQYQGPLLQMCIPEAVLLTENSDSMVYTENNVVKVEYYATNQSFLKKLDLNQDKGNIFPCVINSSNRGLFFSNTIMMNNEIVGNKIIPRTEGFICRKFVQPYNITPNLFRLFYTSKNSKQLKKNYGYKMVNLKKMSQDMFKKKHRLTEQYLVDSQKEDTFIGTIMRGKALVIFEEMAQSMIQYFEKGINIKISEIILDFIIDENKQPWLQEVRSIKSRLLTKLWDIGNNNDLELIAEKNNNSQLCRLCGMMFSRYELEKIVTNKLIWELVSHLQNRGVSFQSLPHLKQEGLSYVCNTCYEVIVAEHKLINIQKQFSSLLNISPNTIERIMPRHKTIKSQSTILLQEKDFAGSEAVPKLKAWRLFFYVQKIKNYDKNSDTHNIVINLEMKFKNFKDHFTKTVMNESQGGLTKMFNSRYSSATRIKSAKLQKHSILFDKFKQKQRPPSSATTKTNQTVTTLASKVSTNISPTFTSKVSAIMAAPLYTTKESYSIQKVKVYTLYTKKHQSSKIFANTEMEFLLTINDEKFAGKSLTLEQLKNKDTCQRHSSQIFMFDEQLKYCNLQLTVGLICDGELMNDNLELEEIDGIYYPAKPFSICKPLPDEWMQVFTKGEEVRTHSKQLSYEQIRQSHLRQESKLLQRLEITDLDL